MTARAWPWTRLQAALAGLWVLLVAPAVPLGYGSDSDAWLVYRTAKTIWRTGEYSRSRSTGFPLYELLVTPLVQFGSWWLANGLSVVFGLVFLGAMFRLWNRGHFRHPLLVVLCTAFLPVFVKNGASTMDYVPAAAVLAWAYVFLAEGRSHVGAAVIGLAAGFRPSSGLAGLPAAAMAKAQGRGWGTIAGMALVAGAMGALAFSPALLKYGLLNAVDSDRLGVPMTVARRLVLAGYYGTQLYGILGTAVLGAALAVGAWRNGPRALREDGPVMAYHAINIAMVGALYLALPAEPEYLFPVLFSVAVLMDRLLDLRVFAVAAVVLLSYHVTQLDLRGGQSGARKLAPAMAPGFTIRDIEDRVFKMSVREHALACAVDRPTVLMFGHWWIPDLEGDWDYLADQQLWRRRGSEFYVAQPILEVERLRELRARGMRVVVWRGGLSSYLQGAGESRRPYVEIVDRLEDLVGGPLRGRAASE